MTVKQFRLWISNSRLNLHENETTINMADLCTLLYGGYRSLLSFCLFHVSIIIMAVLVIILII